MRKTCKDHKGNEFSSIADMCKNWKINRAVYCDRFKHGWTLEKALTTPVIPRKIKSKTDHKGNDFSSITAMRKHWGITKAAYDGRIKRGWSTEKTLTTKVRAKCISCRDHTGKKFFTKRDMCKYWGITENAYDKRIRLGWSLQKTLTTIPKNTDICDDYTVLYQIDYCEDEGDEVNFYMCSIKGIDGPILRDFEDIFNDILQFRETGHIDLIDAVQEGNKDV